VQNLDIPQAAKDELMALSPSAYTGNATQQASKIGS
jgi:hypothetical protein